MRRPSPLGLTLATAVLLLTACASVPLPRREGVVLYEKKCGGCHRLYAPAEISPAKWEVRLPEMVRRAKLTPEETEVIRRYIEPDLAPSHAPVPAPAARP